MSARGQGGTEGRGGRHLGGDVKIDVGYVGFIGCVGWGRGAHLLRGVVVREIEAREEVVDRVVVEPEIPDHHGANGRGGTMDDETVMMRWR